MTHDPTKLQQVPLENLYREVITPETKPGRANTVRVEKGHQPGSTSQSTK